MCGTKIEGISIRGVPFYGDEWPKAKRRKRWADFVCRTQAQSAMEANEICAHFCKGRFFTCRSGTSVPPLGQKKRCWNRSFSNNLSCSSWRTVKPVKATQDEKIEWYVNIDTLLFLLRAIWNLRVHDPFSAELLMSVGEFSFIHKSLP